MERGAVASLANIFILAGLFYVPLNGCSKPDANVQRSNVYSIGSRTGTGKVYLPPAASGAITLFMCGDVMTGRGIDQILPASVDPRIYESYVKDARDYVRLAERKNGEIQKPVDYKYIWGNALEVWEQEKPDVRLINLETSITTQPEPWPEKEVQYRMHPDNVAVLTIASIDFASLANNHTLDWGRSGLMETLQALGQTNITTAGAGKDLEEAQKPAILKLPKGRVIVVAYGSVSSGVYKEWAATPSRAGVNLLPDLSQEAIQGIAAQVKAVKEPGDVVVFSVHWGSNWGYKIPQAQQDFAHSMIDEAGIDLVFGHSSHHPVGMEVYQGKLIVYGAGDFINDYEGISGHEQYRGDLSLMYFPTLDMETGKLLSLKLVPMQLRKFRLHHASEKDVAWLADVLHRESMVFGTGLVRQKNYLMLDF
ncbi:CapA family protein [Pontibacter anaerobius]|uniref:CapA family protein n=1 Tax=Pontibacter anaerobius TaxID=2993940 RepID=A0ABT3RB66_9BACT|nr:CapA family protein [Pontibacter anaerobius]MCX2738995.1 CapA family protein [Pontibacter anaerobius]